MRELVAGEVRAALARARLSGRQAAKILSWTEMYMGRRLSGQVPLDVDDLEALGDLLDLPVTVFFETPQEVRSGRVVRKSAKPDYLHLRSALELAA